MNFNVKTNFYPNSEAALSLPEFKNLLSTGNVEKNEIGMKSVAFTYQCDTDGNVILSSITPSEKSVEYTTAGEVLAKNENTYTVSGVMNVIDGAATLIFAMMMNPGGVELVTDAMFTLKKAYYRAAPSLKKDFQTFMSVDAVLCRETETVIDFTTAPRDYGSESKDVTAVLLEDDKTITFKAFVANGGFNVAGSQE